MSPNAFGADTTGAILGVSLKNWRRANASTVHISGDWAGAPGVGVSKGARTAAPGPWPWR